MAGDVLTEDLLTERIRRAGLRLTLPRRAICRVLAASQGEFLSAATVAERVADQAGQVDASTVYRTLDELGRIGLVHHIQLGNGQPGMWHVTIRHDHEHLLCERCGTTIEVPRAEFAVLYDTLRAKYGFQASDHHFAYLGVCEECDPLPGHPHAPHGPPSAG